MIGLHAAFWIAHLLIRVFISRYYLADTLQLFWIELAELPLKIAISYYIILFLIPRFLKTERYTALGLWSVAGMLFIAFIKRLHLIYFVDPTMPESWTATAPFWTPVLFFKPLIFIFPTAGLVVAASFVWQWFENQQKTKDLETEKLQAELNYLRGQIHPHFLFNTLNNLYALTLKNSPDAPDIVLKLSEMLSYMLYEANESTVSLNREIEQISNYIELEKLRYGNRLEQSFEIEGNLSHVRIAPLLLVTFVENAFKHGVSGALENPFVHIRLVAEGSRLRFAVENSVAPKMASPTGHVNGIGLQNARRRLELLYPEKHKLTIIEKSHIFQLTLQLELETQPLPASSTTEKIAAL